MPPYSKVFADAVVIGGGIVGASIAYHLARQKPGKIILLERETLLGTGSTGRCAGGFRCQFSTEINIRLSLLSVPMILAFQDEMDWPVDLHQDGYLFLLTRPEEVDAFRKNIALQNRLGAPSEFLDPAGIARIAPHVSLDGVLGGSYCDKDGIADPNGMTQGYASTARRLGVEIRTGVSATGIRSARGKIEGVETSQGYIPAGVIVNAAGPGAREVASWAGVDLPVYPERRHVYTTFPFAQAPGNHLMAIDFTTTYYFHRESGGVLMGMGNPGEPSSFNLAVDPDFLEKVLEVGLKRCPDLAGAGINRAWAGLYEMSPDAHPILGRVREVEGFYLANGFSGHGFQHAPVVGKLIAEEIVLGSARTLDITPLRLDRFRLPDSIREANVV
jgi:sarcosine oxidase subunit beta